MSNQSKNSGGAKHTPGPWRVDHNRCLIHGPTELVARLAYTQQGTVQNGNLIAAAPAMYEALRLLLGVNACHNEMIHCGECGYCKGMAALTQAEGK